MKIDSLITQSSAFAIFSAFPSLETHTDCNVITGPSGTGKSALLTHIGLYFILRGYKVLHLSLRDPQVHIQSFYDEIFTELSLRQPQKGKDQTGARLAIERNRMIISTRSTLQNDFLKQRVQLPLHEFLDFTPHLILIDGHAPSDQSIDDFKEICTEYNCAIWFAGAISMLQTIIIFKYDLKITTLSYTVVATMTKGYLGKYSDTMSSKNISSILHQRLPSPKPENCQFYSGGAMGAEAYFGEMCEKFQIQEINYTFKDTIKKEHKVDIFYPIKNLPQVRSPWLMYREGFIAIGTEHLC